jgi:hypothetical protein
VRDGSDVSDVEMNDVSGRSYSTEQEVMASTAALARQDPERIKNMIQDNGDGTYTVTLKQRTYPNWPDTEPPQYVDVPVKVEPKPGFGQPVDPKKEIWPELIEEAFLSYGSQQKRMGAGWPGLEVLTGRPEESNSPGYISFEQMKSNFESGKAIVLSKGDDASTDDYSKVFAAVSNVYPRFPLRILLRASTLLRSVE